jgi:hypothetical protein
MDREQAAGESAGGAQLFLLPGDFEDARNVVHRVLAAEKHPDNPLLPLGDVTEWDALQARPWESRTIIYDEEERLFKCWYAGSDLSMDRWWATGYAVSDDGICWHKPRLGLHEYRGSTENNICLLGWGPVIKDTAEADPTRRYKMIVKGPPRERGVRPAYSPDGIHWTEGDRLGVGAWSGKTPDIVVLFRDEAEPDPARRYKVVWQTAGAGRKPGPSRVRAKCLGFGPDIEHFTGSAHNPILHPDDGPEQENHFVMLFPYRGQYLMLYECGWYAPNGTGVYGAYCADIRLAAGRDGERFERVQPLQPIIRRGRRGQWDDGFLVVADAPVIKDDTIYLYYGGNGEDWTSWPTENIPAGYRYASTGAVRVSRMGLATVKRDRFTCLETADREIGGSVALRPISAAGGRRLRANVSAAQPGRSWVEVEVLDPATGEPLSGYTKEACLDLQRDALDVPITWQDHATLPAGDGPLHLRCWLYGAARLHAVYVTA